MQAHRRYVILALALVLLLGGSASKCPGKDNGSCADVMFDSASGTRTSQSVLGSGPPYIVDLDWTASGWDGDVTYVIYGLEGGGEGGGADPEVDRFTDAVGSIQWTSANDDQASFPSYRIAVECEDGTEADSITVDFS